ncbi:flagellar biosynthetic protein FliO [Novosphingobium sp. AP12]|uniref:FliO/MopB family protein n=1 Tax=Novosphingobium sp. AP12 TaxID=1144305 RepID=UPI000271DDBA|nr:flagellar biosynthetic protein FliO [Novosphingobium sp. AP12]EJL24650.1 flagellar biogenesis protein [Novosphingobium sp. AP12]
MDAWSLLRMLGALSVVLGGLMGALWCVRRYDLTLPRKWLERLGNTGPEKRLRVVERLAIDQRRSVVLLRRDDREFSVMIGPEGVVVLDSALAPAAAQAPAAAAPAPETFASKIPILPEVWFAQDIKQDIGGVH